MNVPAEHRAELLLGVALAAIMAQLTMNPVGAVSAALVVVGLVASVGCAREVGHSERTPRGLWPSVAILAITAVARAPLGSHDLWSYAFYGRLVAFHHSSPYTTTARRFPHDLVYPLVGWRDTPSVYGPIFTAYSAVVARAAGDSLVALRLGFQLPAAAAVIGSLGVLRRFRRHSTLTLFALQPFVWISVVNGGHNDAILAVLLLVAVLAFQGGRTWASAALIAAATLVKMSGGLLVIPLVVIALTRRRWADAIVLAGMPTLALAVSGVAIPQLLTNAGGATSHKISQASVWRPLWLATDLDPRLLTTLAGVTVLALAAAIAWRHRHARNATTSGSASLAVFSFAASYTLPWYAVWGFPIAALGGDLVAAGLIAARGSLMTASYQLHGVTRLEDAASVLITGLAPLALFVLFLRHHLTSDQVTPGRRPGSRWRKARNPGAIGSQNVASR